MKKTIFIIALSLIAFAVSAQKKTDTLFHLTLSKQQLDVIFAGLQGQLNLINSQAQAAAKQVVDVANALEKQLPKPDTTKRAPVMPADTVKHKN